MSRNRYSTLIVAALAALGCDSPSEVVCLGIAFPAVTVEIRDSVTNALVGESARVIATDGAYADTVFALSDAFEAALAYERPGNYTVTVEQTGYHLWTRSGIRVTDGVCNVRTVAVVARLRP